MKTSAIIFSRYGTPEVMQLKDFDLPDLSPHDILIEQSAVGVNFIDTYHRSGLYPITLPSSLGQESAGKVIAIGDAVTRHKIGDRVAVAGGALSAYATHRIVSEDIALALPATISNEQAAASLLAGMTAQYLVKQTFALNQKHICLIHAAAGGVGSILTQWAKYLGATVIATAGSDEKCEQVKAYGADYVINYIDHDFAKQVRKIAPQGVDVVYDGVGQSTFEGSLNCLKTKGMMISFGNASGAVDPIPPLLLTQKGSLFLTRPTLAHYTASRTELESCADDLFSFMAMRPQTVKIGGRYALADAAQAHTDLATRKTTGSLILIP